MGIVAVPQVAFINQKGPKKEKKMFEVKGKYTTAKVMIDDVEESCVSQIHGFCNNSSFTNPIAIMPDTHAGKGSVIGFTMPMTERVIPNVIGVDIGCGMLSFNIGNELDISEKGLEALDRNIRQAVPFGMRVNSKEPLNFAKEFPWKKLNENIRLFTMAYNKKFGYNIKPAVLNAAKVGNHLHSIGANVDRIVKGIGSLGGGNHFIEIGIADQINKNIWVTVHTGSRRLGKDICDYWQDLAIANLQNIKQVEFKEKLTEIKKTCDAKDIAKNIVKLRTDLKMDEYIPKELSYLTGDEAYGYLVDMMFAQMYADVNREYIAKAILDILGLEKAVDSISTIHNFIDFRDFIIRKGSVRAYEGERFVLPFNMADGILICEGKSNKEWNCSAPHGAGRVLPRGRAKRELDLDEFKEQMKGIFSTSVCQGTLDEAPNAYKDAQVIEDAIGPTADIMFKIKPIHNMKDVGQEKKR